MPQVSCLELLVAHRFPSAVRSSAPDPMVGGDIKASYPPKIIVRGIGGIDAVPPPRVDLLAWSEPPPLVKLSRAKSSAGKTGNCLPPPDVRSTSLCDVTTYRPSLLCSAAMLSANITALLPYHMPRHHTRQLPCHSPYLLRAKIHHADVIIQTCQKAPKCPNIVKKTWKWLFCFISIGQLVERSTFRLRRIATKTQI